MSLQAPVQHRGPFSDSVHAALPQIYPMETIILLIIALTLLRTRSLNTTHNHGILLAIMTTLTHMILVICIMYILGCCWFFSITGILKILQTSRMVLFLSVWSFLEMCYTRSAWIIPSRPVLDQQQGRSRGPSIYQRSAVRLNDLLAWKCAHNVLFVMLKNVIGPLKCVSLLLTGNVFITYSVDTASEIIPFVKFLSDQGFEPAVSLFPCLNTLDSLWLSTQTLRLCLSPDRLTSLIIQSEEWTSTNGWTDFWMM